MASGSPAVQMAPTMSQVAGLREKICGAESGSTTAGWPARVIVADWKYDSEKNLDEERSH